MRCRHCQAPLDLTLVDLGSAPPSNAYLTETSLGAPESYLPLKVLVCTHCWLVQTEDVAGAPNPFGDDYAYFSSYSRTWLDHAKRYVDDMSTRFGLTDSKYVVEIAANDGYLLQYVRERGIACLGIEPTSSTAAAARARGITILEEFFGADLGRRLGQERRADLIVANNVLAHVPEIDDFVAGVPELLGPDGVATFEFPHLLHLIGGAQFDTVYHEHFSYLSLTFVDGLFASHGLQVFDVEELPTHGGSLRVFAQHADPAPRAVSRRVGLLLAREVAAGVKDPAYYAGLQSRAEKVKNDLLRFLLDVSAERKIVGAYGAAAKGNTLLNYAGVRPDLVRFVVDANPAKQGLYLPGSRIPIVPEQRLRSERPDYVLVLPWNLVDEITEAAAYIREWGGQFVRAVPTLEVGL